MFLMIQGSKVVKNSLLQRVKVYAGYMQLV